MRLTAEDMSPGNACEAQRRSTRLLRIGAGPGVHSSKRDQPPHYLSPVPALCVSEVTGRLWSLSIPFSSPQGWGGVSLWRSDTLYDSRRRRRVAFPRSPALLPGHRPSSRLRCTLACYVQKKKVHAAAFISVHRGGGRVCVGGGVGVSLYTLCLCNGHSEGCTDALG